MRSELLDGGAYCRTAFQAIAKTATAAGAGDNTEVDCAWVDRMDDDAGLAMSAKLVIIVEAALADGQSLTFAGNMQDASDIAGSDGDDYGDPVLATIVASANSAGSTNNSAGRIESHNVGWSFTVRNTMTSNPSRQGFEVIVPAQSTSRCVGTPDFFRSK